MGTGTRSDTVIAASALIASIPGDEASVAGAVQRFPDRFYGYFMFDPTQPESPHRANAALTQACAASASFPQCIGIRSADERVTSGSGLDFGSTRNRGRLCPLRCVERGNSEQAWTTVPLRHAIFKSSRPSSGGAAVSSAEFRCSALRGRLFPRGLDGRRFVPECLFRYVEQQQLDEVSNAGDHAGTDVFQRSLDVVGPRRLLFGTDSSFFPRGWNASVLESQIRVLFDLDVSSRRRNSDPRRQSAPCALAKEGERIRSLRH